ncbi:MAG: helix-turn-helix transcriptional regulator [Lachnospiraceae bacterium]|nr:helix-turn-helix transcriptional regulator [Lachnospiraceae bacterium]
MENKKTFGAYILRRRKEMGMTQREFAEKLYVTESAVSKWERGMSYPDITLLRTICGVLDISEHELLTGSEDTQKRNVEKLANQYLRLTRNYRIAQYIIYGLILFGCGLGNVLAQHRLDWFFIVLAGVLMSASLTLVPALASLHMKLCHYKAALVWGSFTLSLELLLLICCLYTGGDWFWMAGISVLFGITLLVLPFLLPRMPLPTAWTDRKTSIYLFVETVLFLLLLLTGCLYSGGDWFVMAAVSVVFGLGFFMVPVWLRQLPLPETLKNHKCLLYFTIQSLLLLLLLLTGCLYSGGDWFVVAAVSVVFGLGFFMVPAWLRQLPLPETLKNHKCLLYFAIQSLLLFAMILTIDIYVGAHSFWSTDMPVAVTCLLLPWGLMLAIRYLPLSGWYRAAVSFLWTALWFWLSPFVADRIFTQYYGPGDPDSIWISFDFTTWGGNQTAYNVIAIVLFALVGIAVVCGLIGYGRRKHKIR